MNHRYLPQTEAEISEMCQSVGVTDPSNLFQVIPEAIRLKRELNLPQALSEADLVAHLKKLSKTNETVDHFSSFLGAGAYHHYIPVSVNSLISRGEFFTSYTPYQAELSQGTLQAIFEFQTMVASLMGMEIANASNYDGSTALAEAIMMANRINKKKEIILAKSIHPEYRQTTRTLLKNLGYEIHEVGWNTDGSIDQEELKKILSKSSAVLCVQSPNFFGVIEDQTALAKAAHESEALFVSVTGDPVSLGILASPGSCGADIAIGEGASFGNFLNLGGPYLGLFATKQEFIRQMPGRLVGETTDSKGEKGFVLAFNTREQHIRREKATSNICTNQSLCALAACIHLSLMGPQGLKQLAENNLAKAHYAKNVLCNIPGIKPLFSGETFNEFAIKLPVPVSDVLNQLKEKKIFGGFPLSRFYPELEEGLLVCVTEMVTKEEIDRFGDELRKIVNN